MPTVADLWSLLERSGLLVDADIERLSELAGECGHHDQQSVLRWLVGQSLVTNYQATILATGRTGPFRFGDYCTVDRSERPDRLGQFRAIHHPSGHPVLLDFVAKDRVPPATLARQMEIIERHHRLQHENLTDCYEFVRLPHHKFQVLEDVGEATLELRVKTKGPIEPATAMLYLNQLTSGVQALSAVGLCHGGIHPDAVIGKAGVCRLVRHPLRQVRPWFSGESSSLPGNSPAPLTSHLPYLAPELFDNGIWPNGQGDLYALGCLLFFMLTGRPPVEFSADMTTAEFLRQRTSASIPELVGDSAGTDLDRSVVDVVLPRLLADDPALRYEAPSALLADIACWRESRPVFTPPATRAPFLASIHAKPPMDWTTQPNAEAFTGALPEIQHDYSETVVARSEHSTRRRRWMTPTLSVVLALLTLLIGRWVLQPIEPPPVSDAGISTPPAVRTDDPQEAVVAVDDLPESGAGPARYFSIADDGRSLWVPPTSGATVDFRYVPQGGQFFLAVRPHDVLTNAEGERVVRALGPEFGKLRGAWEQKYGLALEVIESLLVTALPDVQGQPQYVTDVTLLTATDVPTAWQPAPGDAPTDDSDPAAAIIRNGDIACFMPPDGEQRRLIFGPLPTIREIVRRSTAPVLRREFAGLQSFSDGDSHLTMMFAPNYVLRDGRSIVSDAYRRLPLALDEFFGDGIRAALFTAHVTEDECFAELRLEITADLRRDIQMDLPNKIAEVAERVESYIVDLSQLDNHWRQLALRYDNMLRFAAQQTRFGYEANQIVMNASLPGPAAHNLVLASELALAAGVSGASSSRQTPAVVLRTMEDVLAQRTSLHILQQSLEFSVRDLVADVNESVPGLPFPFEVRIVGGDLQTEGITRNQQIRDFRGESATIAELLTSLVMKANPVTTVKSPNETDQKLVWVVRTSPENTKNPLVLITTRKAALAKGDKLPAVFRIE